MALSRVQVTARVSGTGATLAIPFTTPPTLGNAILVPVILRTTAAPNWPTTACTDNYGNTYQRAVTVVNGSGTDCAVAIYYCEGVVATGASFTVSLAVAVPAGNHTGCAIEASSGTSYGLVLDQTKTATGNSAAPATGATAALGFDDEFVVALTSSDTLQASITVEAVSPTWTQEFEQLSVTTAAAGEADSRILGSASGTTTSCSWTLNSSAQWAAALATFRAVTSAPTSRATQFVAETITQPTPDARVSGVVVETLISTIASAGPPLARTSQLVVETLTGATLASVTQLVVETIQPAATEGAVTQLVAETLTEVPPPPLRVSQSPTELLLQLDATLTDAHVSQAPVEVLQQVAAAFVFARVSQAPVEIIYPFGCYIYIPPPTAPCPTELPVDEAGDGGSCAASFPTGD